MNAMNTRTVASAMVFAGLSFFAALAPASANDPYPTSAMPLSKADFSLSINGQSIALGDKWDEDVQSRLGPSLSDNFVGDVVFDDESYKFYQHHYEGWDLYTSNLWWDKADRDVDDYIVAQITFSSTAMKTHRGAFIGMSVEDIKKRYGEGQHQQNDDGEWLFYLLGKKRLSFDIAAGKITAVTLSYDN